MAWFLVQHKTELGQKAVESVVVFDNQISDAHRKQSLEEWSWPSLVFYIVDSQQQRFQ